MFMSAALLAEEAAFEVAVELPVPAFAFAFAGLFATGGVVVTAPGCGASVVTLVFGLAMGVVEAVADGLLSFCSLLPSAVLAALSLADSPAAFRGAMLFPFSEPEGAVVACG
jgi:hypothetical protein